MLTYKDLIKNSKRKLDNPDLARLFLLEILREEGKDLYQEYEEAASQDIETRFYKGLERLMKGEPIDYVLGYRWFYDSKIFVDETVLIPRSETEELVNNILMDVDEYFDQPSIVDVATGSGAIAIALAKDLNLELDASDLSHEALKLARKNAIENKVKVNFYEGDMLDPIIELNKKYDILVCNPPYIKEVEDVDHAVLDFEPHMALFGGDDGLYFYRKVFEKAHYVLKEQSMMAFEIGFDIGEALVKLAREFFPESKVQLKQDIHGLDRMLFIYQGINHRD